jgi:hypothetical protein
MFRADSQISPGRNVGAVLTLASVLATVVLVPVEGVEGRAAKPGIDQAICSRSFSQLWLRCSSSSTASADVAPRTEASSASEGATSNTRGRLRSLAMRWRLAGHRLVLCHPQPVGLTRDGSHVVLDAVVVEPLLVVEERPVDDVRPLLLLEHAVGLVVLLADLPGGDPTGRLLDAKGFCIQVTVRRESEGRLMRLDPERLGGGGSSPS